MQIQISLTHDEQLALNRFGQEIGAEMPDAAQTALRQWLIEGGYLASGELTHAEEAGARRE